MCDQQLGLCSTGLACREYGNPLVELTSTKTRRRNGAWKCGILKMALTSGGRKYALHPVIYEFISSK